VAAGWLVDPAVLLFPFGLLPEPDDEPLPFDVEL
jgi:hypothetical protein